MDYLKHIGSEVQFESEDWGEVRIRSIKVSPSIDGDALVIFGNAAENESPLVRIHSHCFFSEILGIETCDCQVQLDAVFEEFKKEGSGVLVYLRFDGRDVGLASKIAATRLELQGEDTHSSREAIGVPPDARTYSGIGVELKKAGYRQIRLLTNNPRKVHALEQEGLVVDRVPLVCEVGNPIAIKLLETKKLKFGHKI